jgi:Protein of unknown function (DUF3301)
VDLSWSLLLLFAGLAGAAALWHTTLGARELANEAAQETCVRLGARMLDGTVAFRRLRPVRGVDGWLELERTYVFEYTLDGATRRQGFVIVAGKAVESVGLEP